MGKHVEKAMKAWRGLAALILAALACMAAPAALAASGTAANLGVLISNPTNGAVIHGTDIAVTVAASHFKPVSSVPAIGVAAGKSVSPFNVYMLFGGLFVIVVGLLFLGRRYASATTGARAEKRNTDSAVPEAGPVLDTLPTDLPRVESVPAPGPPQPERRFPDRDPAPLDPRREGDFTGSPWDLPWARQETPFVVRETEQPLAEIDRQPVSDRISRARALEMAQQWPSIVQDLVRQLERQEIESRQLQDCIAELEQTARAHDSLKRALSEASGDSPTQDEMQAVQFVMASLLGDPDHIVVLASVAQHAEQLSRVVNNYVRIRRALGES
jgi:hypothetical protein